jgi:hypothetical protein
MKFMIKPAAITVILITLLMNITGCQKQAGKNTETSLSNSENEVIETKTEAEAEGNPENVYWGDTHFHTSISGDAFGGGTRLTPEDSYRLAIGEKIISNTGQEIQLVRPLDFLAITDHAEGFGSFNEIAKGNPIMLADPIAKEWHDLLKEGTPEANYKLAVGIPAALASGNLPEPVTNPDIAIPMLRHSWQEYTATAEKYNNPGKFTALIAYEWTSVPGGNNLHRNIMFRDGKDKADQIIPFSALQSEDPEKLWEFMKNFEEKTGGRMLAIPHNGNISGGLMFSPNDFEGKPIDADYSKQRAKWEPLYEIMQIKGAGETHPLLSTKDEFANYGITGWDQGNLTLDVLTTPEQRKYQYARKALIDGMIHENKLDYNPFKFGIVGATDTHTGIVSGDENNWWGKHVSSEPSAERVEEITKENNGEIRYGWHYLAGGYTAVWAVENTRTALWDAMKRKETYGTTGTRIKLRVFGGYDFSKSDLDGDYVNTGYENGVPMGGDLSASEKAPQLLIHATKDPNWANLDRIQVIKGWVENGEGKEKIYDVVWSGDRKIGNDGKLPSVGNTVNKKDATYSNTIGSPELKTLWQDPEFDSSQNAFYYIRVLEIPSPTWQLYDIVKYGISDVPEGVSLTQQERAWSSPIWYSP